ncbi:MAG: branched-chain amino acid transaminase [bacterium]
MPKLDYTNTKAYLRGDWVDFREANLSIASSSVLYGLSVYTVFNAIWDNKNKQLNIFRLEDHYRRLCNSAKIMDFDDFSKSCSFEEFTKIATQLLRKNSVQEDVLVRITVFIDALIAGPRIHGLKNSISAYVYPMGEIYPRTGIDVCVSSWTRAADNMIPSRAKVNGQYVNASIMKNEALRNGYHEAIALDASGHVSEGTAANLFIVREGKLLTPDTTTDILEGITRATIIKLADYLGIANSQRTIDRTELYIADEAFMCGSSAHITPILSIDKRPVGNGKIGPVSLRLFEAYKKAQRGEIQDFKQWLTKV